MVRFSVVRRGIDARGKGGPRRVYTVELALRSAEEEESACRRVPNARRHEPHPDPFPASPVRRAPSAPPSSWGWGRRGCSPP